MSVKLLTEHHLEFLSLTGGCIGSSESTLVKLLEISCHGSHDNLLLCTVRGCVIKLISLEERHKQEQCVLINRRFRG